jgi:hypothetical protein
VERRVKSLGGDLGFLYGRPERLRIDMDDGKLHIDRQFKHFRKRSREFKQTRDQQVQT